jgi:hypothetical protein
MKVERLPQCGGGAEDGPRQDHLTSPSPPNQDPAGRLPEAADLPAGTIALTEVLRRLADDLPALRAALDRQARPEPLAYRKQAAARMCGMSVRTWERLLSAGKAPRPDAHAGKCPLWTRSTLESWIARGGSSR